MADRRATELSPTLDSTSGDTTSSDDSAVSRRNFFLRAGRLGGAALLGGPAFNGALWAAPLPRSGSSVSGPSSSEGLRHGVLRSLSSLPPTDSYSGLSWRLLGPFRGGRVDAVSGVPGRPNEFYFGSVNGGVWKSVDAGRVWKPVFDDQPVASIGALAVAPSAPDVVYVGTGESTLRDSVGYGNGVYKSVDAGKSWSHMGLADTHHIGRVAVDPTDPDIVFVAAIGHYYGAHPERGVFRSKDGGRSWEKVLYQGADVGACEVVIDPTNPRVVYAGLWNTRRPPWFVYAPTNGPGGGIYKSTDGGDTWSELSEGLPTEGMGSSGIAVCPSEPNRLYACIDNLEPVPGEAAPPPDAFGGAATGQGGFFRSDDAGEHWTKLSDDPALWGRGWYFEHVTVDPHDADLVYVQNVSVSRSMDGGRSWVPLRGSPGGDDYHQAWISPDDPDTMIVSSDQGCIITRNARAADPQEVTWSSWYNQPIAQIYHLSVDPRFPYWVTGAQQDSGSVAIRSRGKFGEISMRDWEPIGAGGESGYTAGDPLHPGTIYGGQGSRYNLELNQFVPGTTSPEGPEPARTDWSQPLVLSKANPRALYYANQFLFKSTDGAESWSRISPDLTRPEPGVPANLDAAAAADVGANKQRGVIYTVAPSPLLVPMVWVGTDDGLIHVSTDDGETWKDVTPPDVGAWSRVTGVEASHFDFNTAYASVDRHQLEDFDPYIYRTRDMGRSWTRITEGLPRGVYVHVVREDPERSGLLFAGTERGAFVSFDDGDQWQPLQLDLPTTSVRDFEVYGNDLIVATHGRGFWVIDDISVLRQIDDAVLSADVHLFEPAGVTLVGQGRDNGTPFQKGEPQAENPPDGAYIAYYLKRDANGPVTLEVLAEDGTVHGTFTNQPSPEQGAPGRGRGRADGIPRTSALWRPEPEPFRTDAGMHRVAWIPNTGGRRGFGRRGPQRPVVRLPGTFTAKLTVNGRSQTQLFTVKPNPVQPT
jgi:photosystem II stability/assembly factor-like uncharacterized protein